METDGVVRLYVCPNKQCYNYYGSSSMGKLENSANRDLKGKITNMRATCAECGTEREERWAYLIPKDHVTDVLRQAGIRR